MTCLYPLKLSLQHGLLENYATRTNSQIVLSLVGKESNSSTCFRRKNNRMRNQRVFNNRRIHVSTGDMITNPDSGIWNEIPSDASIKRWRVYSTWNINRMRQLLDRLSHQLRNAREYTFSGRWIPSNILLISPGPNSALKGLPVLNTGSPTVNPLVSS